MLGRKTRNPRQTLCSFAAARKTVGNLVRKCSPRKSWRTQDCITLNCLGMSWTMLFLLKLEQALSVVTAQHAQSAKSRRSAGGRGPSIPPRASASAGKHSCICMEFSRTDCHALIQHYLDNGVTAVCSCSWQKEPNSQGCPFCGWHGEGGHLHPESCWRAWSFAARHNTRLRQRWPQAPAFVINKICWVQVLCQCLSR